MFMMIDMLAVLSLDQVQGWVEAGGYLVILLLLLSCGLGLPLPEDIPLILSGALAARGQMNLAMASAACWLGIIGGDCILYFMARKYGMGITRVPFVGRHITLERVNRVGRLFDRYGMWVVAGCRLFAGVRAAMVVAAGVTRYSFLKFIIADGLAALVSGGLFIALGWWFGSRLPWLMSQIKQWQNVILIALVIAGAAAAAWLILPSTAGCMPPRAAYCVKHPPRALAAWRLDLPPTHPAAIPDRTSHRCHGSLQQHVWVGA